MGCAYEVKGIKGQNIHLQIFDQCEDIVISAYASKVTLEATHESEVLLTKHDS